MDENIKQNPLPKPASPGQGGSSSYTRSNKSTTNFFEKFFSMFSKKTTSTLVILTLLVGVGAATIAVQNSTEFRQQAATFVPTPIPAGANVISGTVFVDSNGNGVQNSGESDYSGTATIQLGAGNTGVTATKYGTGYYFTNLASKTYLIHITVPSGYMVTTYASFSITVPPSPGTFKFGIKPTTQSLPPPPGTIATPTPTPTPIPLPNLVTTSASKNGVFYEGQSVSFKAIVKNTGAASAGSFDTQFRICQGDNNCTDTDSPRALGTPSTGSLAVNATKELSSGTWGNISRGRYTLRVWPDIYSRVTESNELDNGKWLSVCVEGKPASPTLISPENNDVGNYTNPTLFWTFNSYNNICASRMAYQVRFGTSPTPAASTAIAYQNQITGTYNPGTLLRDTTYYWQIVKCNDLSCNFGPIWSFKTGAGIGGPPPTPCPDPRTSVNWPSLGATTKAAYLARYEACLALGGPSVPWPTPTPTDTVTTPAPGTCYIQGTVFVDNDGDGDYDDHESEFNGATVTRTGSISTTTNSYGFYNFTNLSGAYTITLTVPSGYVMSPGSTNPVSKTVCPDKIVNFGIIPSTTPPILSTTPGVTGNPILPPATTSGPTPTIPAGNTALVLTIGLDAIGNTGDNGNRNDSSGSNKNPRRPTRNVAVELFNSSNNEPVGTAKTGNVIYANGLFTGTIDLGTEFTPQSYNIKIKSDGYLKRKILGVALTAGTNTAPPIALVVGDINGDNLLNIADYNILVSCSVFSTDNRGACNANPQYAVLSDLEDNGAIDLFDYNLFLREYSVQAGD